eukprot:2110781-Prymnesium_polylepis.1
MRSGARFTLAASDAARLRTTSSCSTYRRLAASSDAASSVASCSSPTAVRFGVQHSSFVRIGGEATPP